MSILEMLHEVQFVVDAEGNRKAAQVDFRLWEAIVAYIEAYEKDPTEELTAVPGLVGAIEKSRQRVKSGEFVCYEDIRRNV